MADKTVPAPTVTETKMHRHRVGDNVVMTHNDHDNIDWNDDEAGDKLLGVVESIDNSEGTYITVNFGDKTGTHQLTEDDVQRV